jgi:hypothetical protein
MSLKTKAKIPSEIISEIDRPLKMAEKWVKLSDAESEIKVSVQQAVIDVMLVGIKLGEAHNKVLNLLEPLPKGLKDSTVVIKIKELEELRDLLEPEPRAIPCTVTNGNNLTEGKPE